MRLTSDKRDSSLRPLVTWEGALRYTTRQVCLQGKTSDASQQTGAVTSLITQGGKGARYPGLVASPSPFLAQLNGREPEGDKRIG